MLINWSFQFVFDLRQKVLTLLYPVFKTLFPDGTSTLQQVAKAMINATKYGYGKMVVEVKDIKILAASA
jgi:hypothetical protein